MVLEYVEGGSLFSGTKLAPKKQLSEIQARKYFRDILQVRLTGIKVHAQNGLAISICQVNICVLCTDNPASSTNMINVFMINVLKHSVL